MLLTATAFVACGNDGDSDIPDYSYVNYWLEVDKEDFDYWTGQTDLKVNFDDGTPKGSEWNLSCDVPWVKLRYTRGKVNGYQERVPITIEDNFNYEDREAHIYLDVPNVIPYFSRLATVTLYQYGFEKYFSYCGASYCESISIITNRSIAESSTFSINNLIMSPIMEVDWGDGNKKIFKNTIQGSDLYGSNNLSHNYLSNETYTIKLRFGTMNYHSLNINNFSFYLEKGQGIERIDMGEGIKSVTYDVGNNTKKIYLSYSSEKGYTVSQKE